MIIIYLLIRLPRISKNIGKMNKPLRWTRNILAGIGMTLGTIVPLSAQNYSLSGTVRSLERTTGNPIGQVFVDVDSSSYVAKTDATGYFSINNIPAGKHNIRMSAPGRRGIFKQNYILDANKTLNVCLADTMQESPSGKIPFKLDQYRELPPFESYRGLALVNEAFPNSQTWKNITEGNLIPIRIVNATHLDSLAFKNAIGACDGDGSWSDSPVNSVEYKQKREIYKLTNDITIDGSTKRGILVKFNSGWNFTLRRDDPSDSKYIFAAQVELQVNMESTIQKEVKGRAWNRGDISGRSSYMNASGPTMTDIDHMLNIVFFNQWAAMARNEQQSDILDMEDSPVAGAPIPTEFTQPINNSTGLQNNVQFVWKNKFGTEKYKLEIATDAGFITKVLSKDITRIDTTVTLNSNTSYFARIQTINKNGTGSWYNITFKTKSNVNHAPGAFTTIIPTGEIDSHISNIFKWHKSTDPDGDPITYSLTINGPNFNNVINNITDTLYTITAGTLPGHKPLNYRITATDGSLNTESNTTNITTKNYPPGQSTITKPTGVDIVDPGQPLTVEYTVSTDPDSDPVSYNIRIWNSTKDTTIIGISNTTYILAAGKLKKSTNYNITVTSTDGSLSTVSNIKTFNTIATGIEDIISDGEFHLFPNPAVTNLTVEYFLYQPTEITISVYNIYGQKLTSLSNMESIGKQAHTIDLNSLGTGIYILIIESASPGFTKHLKSFKFFRN
jgi:hypothetical protein